MLAASEQFKAALTQSHIARSRVTAHRRSEADGVWTDTTLGDLPLVGGTVTIDGSANVWHRVRLEVADDTVRADGTTWSDLLTAIDCHLVVAFGVQTDYDLAESSPTVEWVTVATARVDKVTRDGATALLTVEASDDGARLDECDITQPWPGTGDDDLSHSVLDTITKLITDAYPASAPPTVTDVGVLDTTWADMSVFQGGRWEAVNRLAEAIGAWVHCTETGEWLIEPTPYALADPPDWAFTTGQVGTVTGLDSGTDRTECANKVIVRVELPFAGSQYAEAVDDDPTSPTRWDGPMGRVVRLVDNDICTSLAEAQAAADLLLTQLKGRAALVSLASVHNPLLRPGDTISVPLPGGGTESHWVDSVTLPIPAGEMTVKTRVVEVTA